MRLTASTWSQRDSPEGRVETMIPSHSRAESRRAVMTA
jgi:hypothetical protein